MIVITGATGRLGSRVLTELLERVPAEEIGVSTTDPDALAGLAERGVRVRRGDYDDATSLRHAFEGADRVLLISAPRIGEAATAAHRAAIDAAVAENVGRLLYTSHVGSDPLSPFPPAVAHAATEVSLRDSGLPVTVLRNGFYADTPVRLAAGAVESGELRVPADEPVSWTTHDDLAPAIASVLAETGLDERIITLTAGQAIDLAELAALASTITGRTIRHTVVSDEEYRSELIAAGAPEFGAVMTLGIFQASRQGRLGITDPTLGRLIGRPTATLHRMLEAELTT